MATTKRTTEQHPFESFGPAPYHILGVSEKLHLIPGCAPQVAGCCDVCLQTIRWAYRIRAANGVEFDTGCDCAQKAGMSAKDLREAKRSYRYERMAEYSRRTREAREAEERAYNKETKGYALTNAEFTLAQRQGESAAKQWRRAERRYDTRHVGTVGARLRKVELSVERAHSFETLYGLMTIWILRDRANNQLVWKSASGPAVQTKDDVVSVWDAREHPRRARWFLADFTVKEHGEREGLRQTIVQRLKSTQVTSDWFDVDF